MKDSEQAQIFEKWLSRYKALIFKIVRAYARVSEDQQDLFQEITVQVWRSIPLFKGESAVTTWIYRIGLNTAIKWIRKERRQDEIERATARDQILVGNIVESDDRLSWLYDEIHKLDEIDRSVTLLMLDGLSYKEMSTILGITETNVGVKINRIKKQLIGKSKNYDYGT
ncbi:MAG: RNA polymerase sigma factor [Chryseolinea sp.]